MTSPNCMSGSALRLLTGAYGRSAHFSLVNRSFIVIVNGNSETEVRAVVLSTQWL